MDSTTNEQQSTKRSSQISDIARGMKVAKKVTIIKQAIESKSKYIVLNRSLPGKNGDPRVVRRDELGKIKLQLEDYDHNELFENKPAFSEPFPLYN